MRGSAWARPASNAVDAARAARFVGDQAGVFQDLQVLRDGGAADRQLGGERADGAGLGGDALEHGAARGIGQCRKDSRVHAPNR